MATIKNSGGASKVIHGVTEVTSVGKVEVEHDVNLAKKVNPERSIILVQASGFTRKDTSTHLLAVLTDVAWLDSGSFRLKHWGTYSAGILFDIPYTVIEFPPGTRVVRLLQDINDTSVSQHKASISLDGLGFSRYSGIIPFVLPLSKAQDTTWCHNYSDEYGAGLDGKRFEGAAVDELNQTLDLYLAGSVANGRILIWLVQP